MGMSLLRKDVTSDIFSESILAGIQKLFLSLHKISCTRQSESKLSLRSFALSLQKIIYILTTITNNDNN